MADKFKIPKFSSEAEEAQWWYDHRDELTKAFEDAIHSEKRGGSCETCHCRDKKVSSVVNLLSSFEREYTGSAMLVVKKIANPSSRASCSSQANNILHPSHHYRNTQSPYDPETFFVRHCETQASEMNFLTRVIT